MSEWGDERPNDQTKMRRKSRARAAIGQARSRATADNGPGGGENGATKGERGAGLPLVGSAREGELANWALTTPYGRVLASIIRIARRGILAAGSARGSVAGRVARDFNPSVNTPIPTEYKASTRPRFRYAQKALTLSLAPASGTAAQTAGYSHQ
jgi:hypothetical protein